ncbi:hypothetical protein R3P38DRAFT_603207 [Favolaschia claudopus]|uniref:Uncharacterized protein n=1 Tax=Favolaschia claudopus TaxID=2862362 RepID=A0AAW0C828_9AGAR
MSAQRRCRRARVGRHTRYHRRQYMPAQQKNGNIDSSTVSAEGVNDAMSTRRCRSLWKCSYQCHGLGCSSSPGNWTETDELCLPPLPPVVVRRSAPIASSSRVRRKSAHTTHCFPPYATPRVLDLARTEPKERIWTPPWPLTLQHPSRPSYHVGYLRRLRGDRLLPPQPAPTHAKSPRELREVKTDRNCILKKGAALINDAAESENES